ncbi:unnamed protein product [Sympodiomycopsis kandeliae]
MAMRAGSQRKSTLLCFCIVAVLAILVQAAAEVPHYDPSNEGMVERWSRTAMKKLLSRTDEEITEGRKMNDAGIHPTFNPAITRLSDVSSIAKQLELPDPPLSSLGNQDSLTAQIRENRETLSEREKEWKVWVVLVSAPQNDALSRRYNEMFNDTLNMIFPSQDGTVSQILDKTKEVLTGSNDEKTVSREDDVGRDESSRKAKRLADIHDKSVEKAKKYNFGVVDFSQEPDLMWHWWIWKVPVILFITPSTSPDRAYDIRYWKVSFIGGLDAEKMLTYIGHDLWVQRLNIWSSTLSPGGSNSRIPLLLAKPSNFLYDKFSTIPTWMVGIATATFGSTIMKWMHTSGKKNQDDKKEGEKKKTIESKKSD